MSSTLTALTDIINSQSSYGTKLEAIRLLMAAETKENAIITYTRTKPVCRNNLPRNHRVKYRIY